MSSTQGHRRAAIVPTAFYSHIAEVLLSARERAYSAVNYSMVLAYWEIGRSIVEKQHGKERAAYGDALIKGLSERLTDDFGRGFDASNLLNMRRFYLAFPIQDALRPELTWTHYRKLIEVKDGTARTWYMNEAVDEQWSTRQLDRQISTLYYDRLLASVDKAPVVAEANRKLARTRPECFIKNPYVLEFLDLKDYPSFRESNSEQALIDNRMFDALQRRDDDNPTIWLILCSEKKKPSPATRHWPTAKNSSSRSTCLSFPRLNNSKRGLRTGAVNSKKPTPLVRARNR